MKDYKDKNNEEILDINEEEIKDEKIKITRGQITKMYSLLFLHTIIITFILFIKKEEKREFSWINFLYFCAFFFGGIFFSFLILYCNFLHKILSIIIEIIFNKDISNKITNFVIYIILLGINIFGFIYGSKLDNLVFQIIKIMFIIFDFASIIITLLSFCFKNNDSSNKWLIWVSTVVNILIIILLALIYKDVKINYGLISVLIYVAMNYNFIKYIEDNKDKKMNISIFSLPCFLNIYFILFLSLVIIIIWIMIKCLLKICKK